MSMAQLFLTNPVIIFHPRDTLGGGGRGASVRSSIRHFRTTGTFIFARQISTAIFFLRTREHARHAIASRLPLFLFSPAHATIRTNPGVRVNLVSIPDIVEGSWRRAPSETFAAVLC